jgi:hypothetical protein
MNTLLNENYHLNGAIHLNDSDESLTAEQKQINNQASQIKIKKN